MFVHVRERRPRANFWSLDREIDRIFRDFFSDSSVPTRADSRVALTQEKDGVTLRAEVPGVDPAAVKIAVDGRTLTISSERTDPERSEGSYRLREARAESFSHTFRLNDTLDVDAITADCRNGILTVRIPKRAAAQPRQIEVKTS